MNVCLFACHFMGLYVSHLIEISFSRTSFYWHQIDQSIFNDCSDVAEREPLEINDSIYIETSNHCDDASYLNGDYFCPASPTTVPVFKSRSNSGKFRPARDVLLVRLMLDFNF